MIDADDATRSAYAAALQPLGRDILHASDGAEGLGMVLARRPEMIVTDTHLARIDGFSLCDFLRQDSATSNVGILVVTSTSGGAHELAWQHGADEVLQKPCAPELLVSTAEQVLRRMPRDSTLPVTSSEAPPREGSTRHCLSHEHRRGVTETPATPPPSLTCPQCDQPLGYLHTRLGGVSQRFPERWDYFDCQQCGTFQYRHRTRTLRFVATDATA